MQKPRKFSFNEIESPDSPDRGVFDPAPPDDDDLWFLPGPETAAADAAETLPLPRADHPPLVDVAQWQAAEAALAAPLADLTLRFGMLTQQLAQGPAGWHHRLALREAADLSWLAGDRVPRDRLALWQVLRLPVADADAQALVRAGWVARRLTQTGQPADDLAVFLGRQAEGDALDHRIADWHEVMGQAAHLHPVTQAALSYHIWPLLALSSGHALGGAAPLPLIEAAVVAARHAARALPETGASFLPLAIGGAVGLRVSGPVEDRLRSWIAGAGQGVRAATRDLAQLAGWQQAAAGDIADLSGRTPPQLIALLQAWPLVSAAMAETQTGASRAAIQRNLNLLVRRGIAREVTGQGRYRFWAAAL